MVVLSGGVVVVGAGEAEVAAEAGFDEDGGTVADERWGRASVLVQMGASSSSKPTATVPAARVRVSVHAAERWAWSARGARPASSRGARRSGAAAAPTEGTADASASTAVVHTTAAEAPARMRMLEGAVKGVRRAAVAVRAMVIAEMEMVVVETELAGPRERAVMHECWLPTAARHREARLRHVRHGRQRRTTRRPSSMQRGSRRAGAVTS